MDGSNRSHAYGNGGHVQLVVLYAEVSTGLPLDDVLMPYFSFYSAFKKLPEKDQTWHHAVNVIGGDIRDVFKINKAKLLARAENIEKFKNRIETSNFVGTQGKRKYSGRETASIR